MSVISGAAVPIGFAVVLHRHDDFPSNVSLANSATSLVVRSAASSALKMMLTSSMGESKRGQAVLHEKFTHT